MSMSPFPPSSLWSIVSCLFRVCQSLNGETWGFITHFNPLVGGFWLSRGGLVIEASGIGISVSWIVIVSSRVVLRFNLILPRTPLLFVLLRPSHKFLSQASLPLQFHSFWCSSPAITIIVANLSFRNVKRALISPRCAT
ncbi:hypothetical protein B0J14DRAFT_595669 [Halenospora varia]|nr:hypothetical protein B0J14DRAFT_595669 [Halenospora varia]